MKKRTYTVYFETGNWNTNVYCDSFSQAAILSMAKAIDHGKDYKIKFIRDEYGKVVSNVSLPTYTKDNF